MSRQTWIVWARCSRVRRIDVLAASAHRTGRFRQTAQLRDHFHRRSGLPDVGCFGSPDIQTPNLDRMAREGIRFTDFLRPQPSVRLRGRR